MTYEEEKVAVMRWVNKFDSVPTKIIAKLVELEPQKWREITEPIYGGKVRIKKTGDEGRILEVDRDQPHTVYKVNFDGMLLEFRHAFQDRVTFLENRRKFKTTDFVADEFEVLWETQLPKWQTMWAFTNAADVDWLENKDGLYEMSEWYFRIFKHDEFGYFFGFDRIYVDLYTDYWQPLFDSRGLDYRAFFFLKTTRTTRSNAQILFFRLGKSARVRGLFFVSAIRFQKLTVNFCVCMVNFLEKFFKNT